MHLLLDKPATTRQNMHTCRLPASVLHKTKTILELIAKHQDTLDIDLYLQANNTFHSSEEPIHRLLPYFADDCSAQLQAIYSITDQQTSDAHSAWTSKLNLLCNNPNKPNKRGRQQQKNVGRGEGMDSPELGSNKVRGRYRSRSAYQTK